MTHEERPADHEGAPTHSDMQRRRFLGASVLVGTAVLAGCAELSEEGLPIGDGTQSPSNDESGRFRLLISDQPVAIDEFDSLTVSLDRARVFGDPETTETPTPTPADDETPTPTPDDSETPTPTPTPTVTEPPTPSPTPTDPADPTPTPDDAETPTPTATPDSSTPTPTPTPDGDDEDEDDDDGEGHFTLDLDGASVDLTEVVGDRAIEVLDGELPAGEYTKIELYVADIEGIVEGESVVVHVPSGKLQIVTPFEIEAGASVSFVFDINVVRRGNTGEYNLTPVIADSGVIGDDVDEIDEIGDDDDMDDDDDDEEEGDGDDDDDEEDDVDDDDEEADDDEEDTDEADDDND